MDGIESVWIAYPVEILLAELIFLYPAKRKPHFSVRYAAAWMFSITFAVLLCALEQLMGFTSPALLQLVQLIRYLLVLNATAGAMSFSFQLPWSTVIACCTAGYAVQQIVFHVKRLLWPAGFLAGPPDGRYALEGAATVVLVYLLAFLTFGRYAEKNGYNKHTDWRFDLLSASIVFICVGLTRVSNYFGEYTSVTVSLYAITACVMALIVQLVLNSEVNLKHEREVVFLLLQEKRKQYELSKKTMDAINIKYHDLKYRLQGAAGHLPEEELEQIRSVVDSYGRQFKTGSETLDVLLTTCNLQCREEGVSISYTGWGGDLDFMGVMDVYSLFGNAISNAVEAVKQLDDPEKRVVDIRSERVGDMISINVSNFFSGEYRMEDGLPVTTKIEDEGFHGYGMKSMRQLAEKYGGSLSVTVDRNLFNLNIYLMQR